MALVDGRSVFWGWQKKSDAGWFFWHFNAAQVEINPPGRQNPRKLSATWKNWKNFSRRVRAPSDPLLGTLMVESVRYDTKWPRNTLWQHLIGVFRGLFCIFRQFSGESMQPEIEGRGFDSYSSSIIRNYNCSIRISTKSFLDSFFVVDNLSLAYKFLITHTQSDKMQQNLAFFFPKKCFCNFWVVKNF